MKVEKRRNIASRKFRTQFIKRAIAPPTWITVNAKLQRSNKDIEIEKRKQPNQKI